MENENVAKKKIIFEIPPDKHRQLRMIAAAEGKTMKQLLLDFIDAKTADAEVKQAA